MYYSHLFNSNNLLQHLGSYVNKQRNSNSDEFLFHATIVIMSLYKIQALNDFCLSQMQPVKEQLAVKDDKIIVWSPTVVELLTLIPPVLTSLVVMQNKIFPLLLPAADYKQSPPSSFH